MLQAHCTEDADDDGEIDATVFQVWWHALSHVTQIVSSMA
jgi:hypothetical protein